tara:strand:- start:5713 stop:5955 length:243 start_codon:yes stop_codon:yes gene_type:complete
MSNDNNKNVAHINDLDDDIFLSMSNSDGLQLSNEGNSDLSDCNFCKTVCCFIFDYIVCKIAYFAIWIIKKDKKNDKNIKR